MRAIQRRREEQRRLANLAQGLPDRERLTAGQVLAAPQVAAMLRLPHEGDPWSSLLTASGDVQFVPDYHSIDGDNPIQ